MSGVEVIIENQKDHPRCKHGPTLLFSRMVNNKPKRFFACSCCRDRKLCSFFLWENEQNKYVPSVKIIEDIKLINEINHFKLHTTFHKVLALQPHERMYCHDCSSFQLQPKHRLRHKDHKFVENISDHLMMHPTEWLKPLEDAKNEAQYLFSSTAVETIINILKERKLSNVLCIGAPRIHEYILNNCEDMNSLLLDIDKRFLSFFGPLQFCWFNSFNHHFFLKESFQTFKNFLQIDNGRNLVIVTDPPFGGRIEPLAATLTTINGLHKKINQSVKNIPTFWAFPYFMEPQMLNNLPDFHMLDYKVGYDNHPLFVAGPKGRKQGSTVRLFTNLHPSTIKLPADQGYKHCKKCNRWVSLENKHCNKCNSCTSKDGRTYVHCDLCKKCVKPTWKHCEKCSKCAQPEHKCGTLKFVQECFNCKERGHKKEACPKLNDKGLKRKGIVSGISIKNKKVKDQTNYN